MVNAVVILEQHDSIESALRRLAKETQKAKIMSLWRRAESFRSKGERRRSKANAARNRERKYGGHFE